VLELMERSTQPARPLRRRSTMWVPSWNTPCGLAEYTAHLAGELPGVHITAERPDLRGVRLLHIQHENSLFEEGSLTQAVQEARVAGLPVVITEHAVTHQMRAWERDADVLVSLTSKGADVLRARWPRKRVEHLHLGCPAWSSGRKNRRGRVIGVFGFLEPHKGFRQLLDVLRNTSDTEMLMFSYAKSPQVEQAWEQASAGLPVRRERAYLTLEEIAARLSLEADILAFWYDEIPHASASYAVRIGLATGVPVLASPTSWFEDLAQVTYQPADLGEGVRHLLEDTPLREGLVAAAREFVEANSWRRTAERHSALWQSLESG
jgi:glycosyltransferase involved in cell wall biosynthesis